MPVIHAANCFTANLVSQKKLNLQITTSGPVTVTYNYSYIWSGTGYFTSSPSTVSVPSQLSIYPVVPDKFGCGTYSAVINVTSPVSLSAKGTWQVVSP